MKLEEFNYLTEEFNYLTDEKEKIERFLNLLIDKNLSVEDLKLICESVTPYEVIKCGMYENHDIYIRKKYSDVIEEPKSFLGTVILI